MKKDKVVETNTDDDFIPDEEFNKVNVERLFAMLVRFVEKREGVKIKYTVRKKTPEEYAADPDKMVEVSESVRMQIWGK